MLNLVDQGAHVREELHRELISSLDELFGVLGRTNTGRSTGQNEGTSRQGSTLGEEADQLRDAKDQITVDGSLVWGFLFKIELYIRQRAVLHNTAALKTTDVEFASIGDQSRRNEGGACSSCQRYETEICEFDTEWIHTDRASAIESLGETPLALVHL